MLTGIVVALPRERKSLRCLDGDARFDVVVSGPGANNAAKATELLIDRGSSRILSWGVAGALCPELQAGELVEPGSVAEQSGGVVLRIAGAVDDRLLISVAEIVTSAQKSNLVENGASLVDMESFAIGSICRTRGVAFSVCRAVVDTLEAEWIDKITGVVDEAGRIRPLQLSKALFTHPACLLAAGTASAKAMRSLEQRARRLQRTGT